MKYELVVGFETHVQLRTKSKLFCGCPVEFGAPPNSRVCPICLGAPGVLPVLNEQALRLAMTAALALNCAVAAKMKFDRKNYFYPDLPKNYQISQYDIPLASDGFVEVESNGGTKKIRIQRVHMEEDAGKLIHEEGGILSYVDLNRTGVPLVEIVTHPDINSLEEAEEYLRNLKLILLFTGVSDCDMEKGELRCDVNLSVRPKGSTGFGTKTELKNLNSFKFALDAIKYEFDRHITALESGEKLTLETRQYNSAKGVTIPMRSKEEVHDYRYFPEPDLPPYSFDVRFIESIRRTIPELPMRKRERFQKEFSLGAYEAGILASDRALADYFETCVRLLKNSKVVSNWVINEVQRFCNEEKCRVGDIKCTPEFLVALIRQVQDGKVTGQAAKLLLPEICRTGRDPLALIAERGLEQVSNAGEIENLVEEAVKANPKAVEDFKSGKPTAIKFLVGQVMKVSRGKANPGMVQEILQKKLGSI